MWSPVSCSLGLPQLVRGESSEVDALMQSASRIDVEMLEDFRPLRRPDRRQARHARGLRNVRKSGAYRDRTGDLRLAKPALSQLS